MQDGHGVSLCVVFSALFDAIFTATVIGCVVVCVLAAFCLAAEQPVRRLCWLRPTSPLNILLQNWHGIFAAIIFFVGGCA